MRITYPNEPIYIGDDEVKNAFRLIKINPAVVSMHGFVADGYLGFSTGQTFGANYSPQNFEHLVRGRSQQARHLWLHEAKQCLRKCKQYMDQLQMNPNKDDTRPFAQANTDSQNMGMLDDNGNRLPPILCCSR